MAQVCVSGMLLFVVLLMAVASSALGSHKLYACCVVLSRPEPAGVISKFLYVFAGGVTTDPRASAVQQATVAAAPPPVATAAPSALDLDDAQSSLDDIDLKRRKTDVLTSEETSSASEAVRVGDPLPVARADDADVGEVVPM